MHNTHDHQTLWQRAMTASLLDLRGRLAQLDWSRPLTRAEIRAQWHDMPRAVYLRLPAAKCFANPTEVTRLLLQAELREADDLPDALVVAAHGGPPTWGGDPLVMGATQESGSATDTEPGW